MILKVPLGKGTFPPTIKGSLWTISKGLDKGVRERTSVARFLSGLNMEVRDKVELLPYRDLDELVQLCIRVRQQLKRKPSSKSYGFHSYPRNDKAQGILGAAPRDGNRLGWPTGAYDLAYIKFGLTWPI